MTRSGEQLALTEVVDQQQQRSDLSLYLSGITNRFYDYKMALLQATKPEVILIGSSRMMKGRARFFNKSMANLGGSIGNLEEGLGWIKWMQANPINKPSTVILGLDFWWFNESFYEGNSTDVTTRVPDFTQQTLDFRKLLLPYRWVFIEKKFPISLFADAILQRDFQHYGIAANALISGFAKDGSNYDINFIVGQTISGDENFRDHLNRIATGTSRYQHSESISNDRLEQWNFFHRKLTETFDNVVLMIPPVAPTIRDAIIANGNLSYIEQFRKNFDGIALDFHDAEQFGSNNCEFIDGYHPGDQAFAKLLAHGANYSSQISDLVNLPLLQNEIIKGEGLALIPDPMINAKEIDFLDLGCKK